MFGHDVHAWSWLVDGSFLFLLCSFGRTSVQPAQDTRRMDVSKSLEEIFSYYCRPDRFISAANSAWMTKTPGIKVLLSCHDRQRKYALLSPDRASRRQAHGIYAVAVKPHSNPGDCDIAAF
ncbi:hypothetical protein BDV38DRAFT_255810 [Aspergillus pseudotamarii]|uniref:Uncharacterized protein n=1 Tax=Aspergillus pseudotamarii TaxID=132259 RepID=A0A5N6SHP5_ASPPS|nr:uncharacterized protein BDV38DRAFT_255810 [Aspergillus pseudotamarii]KAE8134192.1 hypothetical protein BDV38DRAFT_255810 [Aspergillus pseudotamarii]